MEWELNADETRRARDRIERERDILRASVVRALERPLARWGTEPEVKSLVSSLDSWGLEGKEKELFESYLNRWDMTIDEVDALTEVLERKHAFRAHLIQLGLLGHVTYRYPKDE